MNARKFLSTGCLCLTLLLGFHAEAQAQRRAGGGSRARTGTATRTGPRGTSTGSYQTQVQNDRSSGTRSVNREGQVTTPRGERNSQRSSTVQKTGTNTYDRQWSNSTTGPNGQTRSSSGQGSGTVQRTDTGVTHTYQGTTTAPNGQTYNVSKSSETTRTDTGFERDASRTVTDSSGNVVGSGESHTTGVKGEGTTTTGSWMGPAGTTTYQGQSQRDGDTVNHTWTTTPPNGQTRNGQSTWTVTPTTPVPPAEDDTDE